MMLGVVTLSWMLEGPCTTIPGTMEMLILNLRGDRLTGETDCCSREAESPLLLPHYSTRERVQDRLLMYHISKEANRIWSSTKLHPWHLLLFMVAWLYQFMSFLFSGFLFLFFLKPIIMLQQRFSQVLSWNVYSDNPCFNTFKKK